MIKSSAVFVLLALAACASPGDGTLYWGGTIRLDASRAAGALLVVGDEVAAAGELEELRAMAPAREVHLAGATMVPGLHDAHGHIEGLGQALEEVDLRGAATFDEVIERVAAQAALQEPGTWVLGRGWDQTLWPGGEFPHHADLSARVSEHPVLLERVDGHAALANGLALELASLDASSVPELPGGRVLVDEAGAPTGVLVDDATSLVGAHVPEPDRDTRRRRILRAQEALFAVGLVAVHDMGVDPEGARIFEELAASGELRLRVFTYLWGNGEIDVESLQRYPATFGADGRLDVIGVKLMVDGALGSRGAALIEDYADEPGQRGNAILERDELARLVVRYGDAGLQPATHAIGDHGNRMVLDVYEERMHADPGFVGRRPRIEHAQVVATEDLARFAELGVVPSVQPTHATSDMRWAEQRVGSERVLGAYAWRRLDPVGDTLAFGSDFPVERPHPLEGLYAARTRQDAEGNPAGGFFPDQRMTGSEALAGFTSGAARAVRREADLGTLEPGMRADFVVLDVDPVTCEPRDLLDARVLMTAVAGQVEFDARAD